MPPARRGVATLGRGEDPLKDQTGHRAEPFREQLPPQLLFTGAGLAHRLTTATNQEAAGGNARPGSPGSGESFAFVAPWP